MMPSGGREHRRSRERALAEGFKKGEDRDQGLGVRMVMAPIRWASLLVALSLVLAAFPGFSQALPGVDGLEDGTGEVAGDTDLSTTVDGTTGTLEGSTNTTDDPGPDGLNDTVEAISGLEDRISAGLVDATVACQAHESGDGRLVCTAPPGCQDRLYETRACTPPPQCVDLANLSFECYPREELDRLVEQGPHAAPWSGSPACLPSPHAWDTLVCKLPDACLGDLGDTQTCRPAPSCQVQDGWFVCRPGQSTSSGSLDPGSLEDPGTLDRAELGREAQVLIRATMDTFRSGLDQLRAAYQGGLEEIRADYATGKATARQTYLSCLEDAGRDDPARQACQEAAREQLDALRAEAREEERQLREGLLDRAETLRAGTCQHLASQGQALVRQAGGIWRLTEAVDVTNLSLCQEELARLSGS